MSSREGGLSAYPWLSKIFAALIFFFVTLAYTCYWADSEIWGLSLAREVNNSLRENTSIYFKLSFYAFLKLAYFIPGDNLSVFYYGRTLFLCVGLGIVFLTHKLALRLFYSREISMLSVVLLLGATTFLGQGFRMRSDLFAAVFNLIILIWLVDYSRNAGSRSSIKACLILIILNALMIGSTPKALFFYFPTLIFALLLAPSVPEGARKKFVRTVLFAYFLPIAVVFIYLMVNLLASRSGSSSPAFVGYWGAWRYFVNAFMSTDLTDLNSPRLIFARQFMFRNLDLLILFLTPIASLPFIWLKTRKIRVCDAFRGYTFFIILVAPLYSDILPFFIASILPALAISAAYFAHEESESFAKIFRLGKFNFLSVRKNILLFLSVLALGKAGFHFGEHLWLNNNFRQAEEIRFIEKIQRQFPSAVIYDVVGLLPRNNRIFAFAGPGQDYQNKIAFTKAAAARPDLILYIKKSIFLEPQLTDLLNEKYADLGYGYFGLSAVHKVTSEDIGASDPQKLIGVSHLLETLEGMRTRPSDQKLYIYLQKDQMHTSAFAGLVQLEMKDGSLVDWSSNGIDGITFFEAKAMRVPKETQVLKISVFAPVKNPQSEHLLTLFSFDKIL